MNQQNPSPSSEKFPGGGVWRGVGNGTEGAMDLPVALLLNEVGKVLGTLHLRRAYPLARIAYLQ